MGRRFLVAPVTLIVPGVLNGSEGPLYYPPEEVRKNPDVWDGMPILRNHPEQVNGPHSGRTPLILDKQGMGWMFNSSANKDSKLQTQFWFDAERTMNLDRRIYDALLAGKKIEISTGLFTVNTKAENGANYNGIPYSHVAKDYRPDHVAVLFDTVGACSLADGCGVHNERGQVYIPMTKPKKYRTVEIANCVATGKPGPCAQYKAKDPFKGLAQIRRRATSKAPSATGKIGSRLGKKPGSRLPGIGLKAKQPKGIGGKKAGGWKSLGTKVVKPKIKKGKTKVKGGGKASQIKLAKGKVRNVLEVFWNAIVKPACGHTCACRKCGGGKPVDQA